MIVKTHVLTAKSIKSNLLESFFEVMMTKKYLRNFPKGLTPGKFITSNPFSFTDTLKMHL